MDLKKQVEQLITNGLGYKRIASVLGISVNTVKSMCQRHHLERQQNKNGCRLCGGALHHINGGNWHVRDIALQKTIDLCVD